MEESEFPRKIRELNKVPLITQGIHTFQVNVGFLCNQSCRHCHHQAKPERTEIMSRETMDMIVRKAEEAHIATIDITGGAPELNPNIREFIQVLKTNGHHIMLRTNLTALLEEGNEDLAEFYRLNGLELIASLPCYEKDEVDRVRGDGVFEQSIEALKTLNSYGYGVEPGLVLNLVYNPMSAFLPPPQEALKEEYASILWRDFKIRFNDLFTITNMPVGRFLDDLEEMGKKEEYLKLLKGSFNPATLENLMCLYQISIGWEGTLYDCDFNQALGLTTTRGFPRNIRDLEAGSIPEREIVTGEPCFGCTAGAGSSCGGALVE